MAVTGRRLILNDGTIIEDGEAGYSQGALWLYITGYTMAEAAVILFDPAKTAKIVFQYGEMQDEYEGYTSCRTLMIDVDGRVSACMVKE